MCNVAYEIITAGIDPEDRQELDDQLVTPPGEDLPRRSRGTEALMSMFQPGGLARK